MNDIHLSRPLESVRMDCYIMDEHGANPVVKEFAFMTVQELSRAKTIGSLLRLRDPNEVDSVIALYAAESEQAEGKGRYLGAIAIPDDDRPVIHTLNEVNQDAHQRWLATGTFRLLSGLSRGEAIVVLPGAFHGPHTTSADITKGVYLGYSRRQTRLQRIYMGLHNDYSDSMTPSHVIPFGRRDEVAFDLGQLFPRV